MKRFIYGFLLTIVISCSLFITPVRAVTYDWSKPRPQISQDEKVVYNEIVGKSCDDGICDVDIGVHICDYVPRAGTIEYDELRFRVSASANTRMGIHYDVWEEDYYYYWVEVNQPTGITGDDDGAWIDLGFSFLYYGVYYHKIWVCSNGFITLNKTYTSPNPQNIPSTDKPNPIIAVFWRDLHFGEGSSITYGWWDIYFVVSWNNLIDDSGNPQTFQVLIQPMEGGGYKFHDKIIFQYKSITKNYQTTVGIEDQVGNKGTAYNYQNLHNEMRIKFENIEEYRLSELKIKLTKSDIYAKIDIERTDIGGYNVVLESDENKFGNTFELAIKTAASLALAKAGIIWKAMLITAEFAWALAGIYRPHLQTRSTLRMLPKTITKLGSRLNAKMKFLGSSLNHSTAP